MSALRCVSCRVRFPNERAAVRHVLINGGHRIVRSYHR
jgi:hypothetical protein